MRLNELLEVTAPFSLPVVVYERNPWELLTIAPARLIADGYEFNIYTSKVEQITVDYVDGVPCMCVVIETNHYENATQPVTPAQDDDTVDNCDCDSNDNQSETELLCEQPVYDTSDI